MPNSPENIQQDEELGYGMEMYDKIRSQLDDPSLTPGQALLRANKIAQDMNQRRSDPQLDLSGVTWDEVASLPQYNELSREDKLQTHRNYYEKVFLPQIAHLPQEEQDRYSLQFNALTYKDIARPRTPAEGLKSVDMPEVPEQSIRAANKEESAQIDEWATPAGGFNKAAMSNYNPQTGEQNTLLGSENLAGGFRKVARYADVTLTSFLSSALLGYPEIEPEHQAVGTSQGIASALGGAAGFVFGGGGRIAGTVGHGVTKKIIGAVSEKGVKTVIGRTAASMTGQAIGLGTASAAMNVGEAPPSEELSAEGVPKWEVGKPTPEVMRQIVERGKAFVYALPYGAGFGVAGSIKWQIPRMVAMASVTGLPSTLRGDDAATQAYEWALGSYFGIKHAPIYRKLEPGEFAQMERDNLIQQVKRGAPIQRGKTFNVPLGAAPGEELPGYAPSPAEESANVFMKGMGIPHSAEESARVFLEAYPATREEVIANLVAQGITPKENSALTVRLVNDRNEVIELSPASQPSAEQTASLNILSTGLGFKPEERDALILQQTGLPNEAHLTSEAADVVIKELRTQKEERLAERPEEPATQATEPAVTVDLATEAKRYKTADEFVREYAENPDKIPTTPEYQQFLKEQDAFTKRENEIYAEMKAMRDKYEGQTINDVPASDISKYEKLQKELDKSLSAKTSAISPKGVIKTHIGEKALQSQLRELWESANKPAATSQPVEAVNVPPQPATAPEAKQPFEMTREEYRATWDTPAYREKFPNYTGDQDHAVSVFEAKIDGKEIPQKVKDQFPDLFPKTETPQVAETPADAVEQIIEGKRESTIGGKEFKVKMLAELDAVIDQIKNKRTPYPETVVIDIPGDGKFTLDLKKMKSNEFQTYSTESGGKGKWGTLPEQLDAIRRKIASVADAEPRTGLIQPNKPPRSVPASKFNDAATAKKLGYTKNASGEYVDAGQAATEYTNEKMKAVSSIHQQYSDRIAAQQVKYNFASRLQSELNNDEVINQRKSADHDRIYGEYEKELNALNNLKSERDSKIQIAEDEIFSKYYKMYPDLLSEQKARDEGIEYLHNGVSPSDLKPFIDILSHKLAGSFATMQRWEERGYWKKVASWFEEPGGFIAEFKAGMPFVEVVHNTFTFAGMFMGKPTRIFDGATKELTSQDTKWLDEGNNGIRLMSDKITGEEYAALPESIKRLHKTWVTIRESFADIADDNGVTVNVKVSVGERLATQMRKLEALRIMRDKMVADGADAADIRKANRAIGGVKSSITGWKKKSMLGIMMTNSMKKEPFGQHIRKGYFPRVATNDARVAIATGQGMEFRAIKEWSDAHNYAIQDLLDFIDPVHAARDKVYGSLEHQNMWILPETLTLENGATFKFLESNPLIVIPNYIHGASMRIATIRAIHQQQDYGIDTFTDYHDAITSLLKNTKKGIVEESQDPKNPKTGGVVAAELVDAVWDSMNGVRKGMRLSTKEHPLVQLGLSAEAISRTGALSMSTVGNAIGGWFPIYAKTDLKTFASAFLNVWKAKMGDVEAQRLLEVAQDCYGFTYDQLDYFSQTASMQYKSGQISKKVLQTLGFEWINRQLNKVGSLAAMDYLSTNVARIKAGDSKAGYLKLKLGHEFGWSPEKVESILKNGVEDVDIARAVQTFSSKTNVFRENPLDVPPWMRTELGSRFVALLSWQRAMGNMLTDVIWQARQGGDYAPMARFLLGGAVSQVAINVVKDFILDKDKNEDGVWSQIYMTMLGSGTLGLWGGLGSDLVWMYRLGKGFDSVATPPTLQFASDFTMGLTKALKTTLDSDKSTAQMKREWVMLTKRVPIFRFAAVNIDRAVERSWESTLYDAADKETKSSLGGGGLGKGSKLGGNSRLTKHKLGQ